MKNQIEKLKQFYQINNAALAKKIGITERQLYNCINNVHVGRFLKEKIDNMVQKIESL